MADLNYQKNGTDLNKIIATTENTNWTLPSIGRATSGYKINSIDLYNYTLLENDIVQDIKNILETYKAPIPYSTNADEISCYTYASIPQRHSIQADSDNPDTMRIDDVKYQRDSDNSNTLWIKDNDNLYHGFLAFDASNSSNILRRIISIIYTTKPMYTNENKEINGNFLLLDSTAITDCTDVETGQNIKDSTTASYPKNYEVKKVKHLRNILTFIACGAGGSGGNGGSATEGAGGGGGGGYGLGIMPLEENITYKFTLGYYGRSSEKNKQPGQSGGDTKLEMIEDDNTKLLITFHGGRGGKYKEKSDTETGAGGTVEVETNDFNGYLVKYQGSKGGLGSIDTSGGAAEAGADSNTLELPIINNNNAITINSTNAKGGDTDTSKNDAGGGGGASLGFGGHGGYKESTGNKNKIAATVGTLGGGGGGGSGHIGNTTGGTGGRGAVILFFD